MKFSLEKDLQKHSCLHSGDPFDSEQQLYKIARNTENPKGNSTITINEERMVAGFRAVTELSTHLNCRQVLAVAQSCCRCKL